MDLNIRQIFAQVKERVPEMAFDREFILLKDWQGPEVPAWLQGRTLYEIYVRAFSEAGTFKGVTERLPELKELGIDVVWLMPIYPIGQQNRKGRWGSPYAIRDYFNVNPEYGTAADFRTLVQTAHAMSMKVVIDMVPNHVAPDYVALQDQPHLIARDAQGRPRRKVADWSDIVDLDYGNARTREHMAQVMKFWIDEFDVDGYRCDVAGFVPLDFWEWVVPQLKEKKHDFYLLAEWESPRLHRVFHSTYDWSTLRLLRRAFHGEVALLARWILAKQLMYPQNALPLRFLENHDLPRARTIFPGEQWAAALTVLFSLHGLPLIYNGQEWGASATPSLFERQPIERNESDERFLRITQKLIGLRKKHPALSSGQYFFFDTALRDNVLVFDKGNTLRVMVNFSPHPLPPDPKWFGDVKDVLFNSRGDEQSLEQMEALKPYQAVILNK
jgi:glycosidase